ncbi:CAAX protease self-immunity [Brevibacterium siliguriense]|uniref:CAAX protease self-immunity n=1 Tax=Brevibacterium siliguriense TaxID=1136497 RepID=A0A1H1NW68_9MICO|nr:CPBP family intramembrane glutamic endopeptidase [Brevibacterium siliguriense]SDS03193.1 CAAX protease self-immunity [Brevibacterium siliguriense]
MRDQPYSLRYHRQFAAQPGHRWFKPILVALLTSVFYMIAVIGLFATFFLWALFALGADGDFNAWSDQLIDMNTTTGALFGLVSVILMWPAAELATLCIYRRSFSSMISIRGGMRWGQLGRYLLVGTVVWVVCAIVMVVFSDGAMGNLASGIVWNSQVLAILIAIILLVPFQATAEEIVFRGLAMNIIGSWLRHPAWAVFIPVPFFVVGHLYDLPGLIDVGIFAVIVGTLTIITGGLEAGIAFHIVNNVFAFGLGVLAGADLNATSAPTIEVVMSIAAPIVFGIIGAFVAGFIDSRLPKGF